MVVHPGHCIQLVLCALIGPITVRELIKVEGQVRPLSHFLIGSHDPITNESPIIAPNHQHRSGRKLSLWNLNLKIGREQTLSLMP